MKTRERGTPIALDPSPDPDKGTVKVTAVVDEVVRGRTHAVSYVDVLSGDALHAAQADNDFLYMLHAKTCPAEKPFNPRPAHVQLHLPPRAKGPR